MTTQTKKTIQTTITCDLCGASWSIDGTPNGADKMLIDERLLPNLVDGMCIEHTVRYVDDDEQDVLFKGKLVDVCARCRGLLTSAIAQLREPEIKGPYR